MRKQNYVVRSGDLSHAAWSQSGVASIAAVPGAPAGLGQAYRITGVAGAGEKVVYQLINTGAVTSDGVWCLSVYAKPGTASLVRIRNVGTLTITYDLSTQTTSNTSFTGGLGVGIEPVGDGWYRCWVSGKVGGVSTDYIVVGAITSDGGTIDLVAPQASFTNTPVAYVATTSAAINCGVPRGRAPQQNLAVCSSSMTNAAQWTTSSATVTGPDTDGYFTLTDTSSGAFGQVTQNILNLTIGLPYTCQFKVKKTTGGTSPSFGCFWFGSAFRMNTDTGAYTDALSVSPTIAVVDRGEFWDVALTYVATATSYILTLYPAVGLHNALPSLSNQTAAATGSALIKDVSVHQGTGLAPYVATGATAINEGAPRGQAPRQNRFQYSDDPTNAYWAKTNVTFGSGGIAPDGASQAIAAYETAANGQHNVYRTHTDLIPGRTYTFSTFVKKYSGTRSVLLVAANDYNGVYFDLDTGALQAYNALSNPAYKYGYKDVGNGWWFLWVTYVASAATESSRLEPAASLGGTSIVVGSTSNAFAYWGIQHTESNGPTARVATTVSAVNDGAPRWQLPAQNTAPSTDFTVAGWVKANVANPTAAGVGPEGQTAYLLASSSAAAVEHILYAGYTDPGSSIGVYGRVVTNSCYVKAGNSNYAFLRNGTSNTSVCFDLVNGTVSAYQIAVDMVGSGIEPAGNGWYRIWISYPLLGPDYFVVGPSTSTSRTFADANASIYVCAPQRSYTSGPIAFGAVGDTGTPRGRAPKQNIALYSEEMTSTVGYSGATGLATYAIGYPAPDGSNNAVKITEDTSNGLHFFSQWGTLVGVTGLTYTASVFVKGLDGNHFLFGVNNGGAYAAFNLTTGLRYNSLGASLQSYGSVPVGDGWWRVWVTYTQTANGVCRFYMDDGVSGASYTGTGKSIYLWGLQVAQGTGLSDYVKTTSTAVNQGAPRAF